MKCLRPKVSRGACVVLALLSLAAGGCAGLTGNSNGGNHNPPPSSGGVTTAPATVGVRLGTVQQFSANVTGLTPSTVTWSVNGVAGGNSAVGTINSSGLYTPHSALPSPNTITIEATSHANSSAYGTSAVTIENPVAVVRGIYPSTLALGAFTLDVSGGYFVKGAKVMFGNVALTTTFVSGNALTATGTAATAGTVNVTVENPDPGAIASTTFAPVVVAG
ncbi:MAG: IPT/TIG domain-containing protein [Candidatus Acidiferrales bacterium]